MASAVDFAGFRRRRPPFSGSFFTPDAISASSLIQMLISLSRDLATAYSSHVASFRFQKKNARSLLLKVQALSSLFEYLKNSNSPNKLPSSATVCLKELYILIYRSKLLLDYLDQSSRLWILLQNNLISGNFHDLTKEIATILDVFPIRVLNLDSDLEEVLKLLRKQCRKSKLYVDHQDESLRLQLYSFLNEFENGRIPDAELLKHAYFVGLGMRNVQNYRYEIKFLEEQIYNSNDDPMDISTISGLIALTRYCRFSVLGFVEESQKRTIKSKKIPSFVKHNDASIVIPKDFCCPISLDIMQDPVIISTGQTYDRTSITQWMEDGRNTCPNSGQILAHTSLVPNKALKKLISNWCYVHGISYDNISTSTDHMIMSSSCKSAVEANRATARLIVKALESGVCNEICIAVRELRQLAKTGKENRACIAEAGAIPLLQKLLESSNCLIQENSITALLNLSIAETNKGRIIGCLTSITNVLVHGHSPEVKENAAATLFSLSSVHEYKKRISDEPGAVYALARLLSDGSLRGKKDAVTALFNLSTHSGCFLTMVKEGAVKALVEALTVEEVVEEAAGALALLVREKAVAQMVGNDEVAVGYLLEVMRTGSGKGKENAVAVLNEMCRSGGREVTERVAGIPLIGVLVRTMMFTGTKRARRKAAALARMCQRGEMEARMGAEYVRVASRNGNFIGGDLVVSVAVPVL